MPKLLHQFPKYLVQSYLGHGSHSNILGGLSPSKAYFVAVGDAGTIAFAGCAKSSTTTRPVSQPVNPTPRNGLHYTAISRTIAFPEGDFPGSVILPNDVAGPNKPLFALPLQGC